MNVGQKGAWWSQRLEDKLRQQKGCRLENLINEQGAKRNHKRGMIESLREIRDPLGNVGL